MCIKLRYDVVGQQQFWTNFKHTTLMPRTDHFIYVNDVQGWQKYRKFKLYNHIDYRFAKAIFDLFFVDNVGRYSESWLKRKEGTIFQVNIS